ncbi:hypothetical protein EMIHUDRAFT_105169 [Emiliania huxleyi CCMP1516]|uniref:Ankyrin repeat protein n=2 Tax=Emiliania huxleyi TaxID=2903 RepID=A0A0D3IGM8_EMIH1|nr:hypothetical protein EMIHUDRAFT_105169 [Emiliania huxleyi CCMP1516]EOD10413.1 hypothetical protein EMIHUDRAFT_105169 [Emiliania huxleyi CCMP1516]|eukprot:XP_005762842.1 hypothetical protein EMIHUDRAFT_105169 [Emiliania huxleyi CCMP1516]
MRSGPRNELTQAIKALDLDKLKEQRRWRAPRRRSQSAETLPGALRGASDGLSALELVVQAVAASGGEAAACDELDDRGISPLHSLVQAGPHAGHVRAAGMLLRAGADANVQSAPASDEYTSGQWGKLNAEGEMEEPSTPMVELLLSHRADPNLRDQQGRSALHLALDFEEERGGIDLALCEKLLAHGARPFPRHGLAATINKKAKVIAAIEAHACS